MRARPSKKQLRRPDVNRTARELDETFWRWKNPVLLTDIRDTSVIRNIPARHSADRACQNRFTNHYAPDCGRPTRGSFAIWTSDPCQLRLGGLARTWGMYGTSAVMRAGRPATDKWHPTGYADQGPRTAGLPSKPVRAGKVGSREVRKADCAYSAAGLENKMSLDVHLEADFPPTVPNDGSGIFIRRNGQTVEMTRAEWDRAFPGQEPVVVMAEANVNCTVYSANITHNLNKMADAAGIYRHLWRPEELGITKAKELIEPLHNGLEKLKEDPARFDQLNPSNGWGTYAGLVSFVENYLAACIKHPEAIIRVSR